jgi:phosphoserine phosphatase RsbU/P
LFCGVLDAERRKLTYVNAGHPPPIILAGAGGGQIRRAEATGMPIGILPANQYGQETIDLEPGNLLFCISDGIAEVFDASGAMWEEAEIETILLRHQNARVAELIQAVVERAAQYSAGADQYDDMTIVAVRVSP